MKPYAVAPLPGYYVVRANTRVLGNPECRTGYNTHDMAISHCFDLEYRHGIQATIEYVP